MGKWDVDNREKFGVKINPSDPKAEYLADKLSGSLEADTVNNKIGLGGDSDTPGNSKYYGTDSVGDKGFHDVPAGRTMIDDDTFATASDSSVASSESIKAYVDDEIEKISIYEYSTGTNQINTTPAEINYFPTTTPTKKIEFYPIFGGTATISFQMKSWANFPTPTVYAQIYVNDVATGTLRTLVGPNPSYVTYSESISWEVGDSVNLRCWDDGGHSSSEISINTYTMKTDNPIGRYLASNI